VVRKEISSATTRTQVGADRATYTRRGDNPWCIPWRNRSILTGGGEQGVPDEGATHPKSRKVMFPLGLQGLCTLVDTADGIFSMAGEGGSAMSRAQQKAVVLVSRAQSDKAGEEHRNWAMELMLKHDGQEQVEEEDMMTEGGARVIVAPNLTGTRDEVCQE
jgi:hypothetical protein